MARSSAAMAKQVAMTAGMLVAEREIAKGASKARLREQVFDVVYLIIDPGIDVVRKDVATAVVHEILANLI